MRAVPFLSLVLWGCLWPLPLESQTPADEPSTSAPLSISTEAYDLRCSYTASADAPDRSEDEIDYDWGHFEECARLGQDGLMEFKPSHLERMRFDDGLAEVAVSGRGWFWVRPNGESLDVVTYDNSPDPWSEGLVRGRRDGQVVYFTRGFEEATGQRYDWAWPFENGRALVCRGCTRKGPSSEHPTLVGGTWWYIDPAGGAVGNDALSGEEISRLRRMSTSGAGQYR